MSDERTGPAPDGTPGPRVGASGSGGAASPATPDVTAASTVPFTQQLGRVTVVVLAVLFGVFAVTNAQPVTFSWVFGRTEAVTGPAGTTGGVPLIVLLVASFAVGAAIGALVTRRRGARRAR